MLRIDDVVGRSKSELNLSIGRPSNSILRNSLKLVIQKRVSLLSWIEVCGCIVSGSVIIIVDIVSGSGIREFNLTVERICNRGVVYVIAVGIETESNVPVI